MLPHDQSARIVRLLVLHQVHVPVDQARKHGRVRTCPSRARPRESSRGRRAPRPRCGRLTMTITWFARFVPVRGSNRRPARMATPSGGGGSIVTREASNGGASGRPCAKHRATKFPASKTAPAIRNAAFHQDFQAIAILRNFRSFELEFRQGIYLHPRARVSNQNAFREI
jgi:hypothetical protein